MKTFAERLRFLRGDKSQETFSDEIGLSQRGLSRYETGKNSPDIKLLQRVCEKLGVEAKWLLFGEGSMRPEKAEAAAKTQHIAVELTPTAVGMQAMIKILEEELAAAKAGEKAAQDAEKAALAEALKAYKLATEAMRPATTALQKEPLPTHNTNIGQPQNKTQNKNVSE